MASIMETSVTDPEETGGLMSKHVTYLCRSNAGGGAGEVRRRYNDFGWLHDRLDQRYPGLCVPPLPPSGGLKKHNKAFIKKRMAALGHFLAAVARHPILAKDKNVVEFLTVDGRDAWKVVTKRKGGVSEEREGNASEAEWRDSVTTTAPDASWNTLDVVSMATTEIDVVVKALKGLKASVKSLIEREGVYAAAVAELQGAVAGWLQLEDSGVKKLAGEAPDGQARNLTAVLGQVSGTLDREQQHAAVQAERVEDILLEAIRFELASMDAIKEKLRTAKDIISAQRREEARLKAEQEKLQTAKTEHGQQGGKEKDVEKAEAAVMKVKALIQANAPKVMYMEQGLLVLELNRLRTERTHRVRSMFSQYAALRTTFADSLTSSWGQGAAPPPQQQQQQQQQTAYGGESKDEAKQQQQQQQQQPPAPAPAPPAPTPPAPAAAPAAPVPPPLPAKVSCAANSAG